MNLSAIVKQLEFCKFRDEIGHPLELNTAFIELKKMAEQEAKECPCCHGSGIITKDVGESWTCEECDGTGLATQPDALGEALNSGKGVYKP